MPPNLNYYKTVKPVHGKRNTTVRNNGNNGSNRSTRRLRRGIGSRDLPVLHHVKFKGNNKITFPNTVENVESRISLGNNYKNIYNTRRQGMTQKERNAENAEEREIIEKLKKNQISAEEVKKYRKKILKELKTPNNN